MNGERNLGRICVRPLLASSSVAALLVGAGTPPALAISMCKITVTTPSGPVTNSTTANCINIFGTTVTGNVANTGTITTGSGSRPTGTGITINNSTVTGTVTNSGAITAHATGILIENSASVAGGISNSSTVFGGLFGNGLRVFGVSVFAGPIINTGLVRSGENGIYVEQVTTFSGGISNSATITANGGNGLSVFQVSVFASPIMNSGLVRAGRTASSSSRSRPSPAA